MNTFHTQPQVAGVQPQQPVQPMQQPYQQYQQQVNPMQSQQVPQQSMTYQPMQQQVNTYNPYQSQGPQPMQMEPMYQGGYVQPMAPAQTPHMQPATVTPTVNASNDVETQTQAFMDAAGVSRSQVEQELSQTGSISAATRQALVAKHGEGVTNLIANNIQTMFQSAKTQSQNVLNERYSYVQEAFKDMTPQTGEQTFQELVGWWNDADPATGQPRMDKATKAAYNKMLKAGGAEAKLALDNLIKGFREQNGAQQQQAFSVEGNNNSGLGGSSTFLSASDYAKQYDDIVRKEGANSPKLRQLDMQRTRSMNMQPR